MYRVMNGKFKMKKSYMMNVFLK